MPAELPESLEAERAAVEAEIRAAFSGVTRTGGVSWSQAQVIDPGGEAPPRALAEALARDIDRSWEELVDDPAWLHDTAVGGFSFLDPIGTRYYLPPAIIREVRLLPGHVASVLTIDNEGQRRRVCLLTRTQSAAVARFCRFMIALCHAESGDESGAGHFTWAWQTAYDSYWREFDRQPR